MLIDEYTRRVKERAVKLDKHSLVEVYDKDTSAQLLFYRGIDSLNNPSPEGYYFEDLLWDLRSDDPNLVLMVNGREESPWGSIVFRPEEKSYFWQEDIPEAPEPRGY